MFCISFATSRHRRELSRTVAAAPDSHFCGMTYFYIRTPA